MDSGPTVIETAASDPWKGIGVSRDVHVRKEPGGRCIAAKVVRHWEGSPNGSINVLLFPDGSNDDLRPVGQDEDHGAVYALPWMTSVAHESSAPPVASWHWPERV